MKHKITTSIRTKAVEVEGITHTHKRTHTPLDFAAEKSAMLIQSIIPESNKIIKLNLFVIERLSGEPCIKNY